ncbi:hypothetical protein BN1013_01766 [Candidatus Rubidus massiliensis]|nr:hypothetical protein BN1013_01766 [Candidatus Rubidus massiliensis]
MIVFSKYLKLWKMQMFFLLGILLHFTSLTGAPSVGTTQTFSPNSSSGFSLDISANGYAGIIWRNGGNHYVSVFNPITETWSTPFIYTTNGSSDQANAAKILVDDNGNATISYVIGININTIRSNIVTNPSGNVWSSVVQVPYPTGFTNTGSVLGYDISIDKTSGNLTVIWTERESFGFNQVYVFLSFGTSAGSWLPANTYALQSGLSSGTSFDLFSSNMDRSGNFVVNWKTISTANVNQVVGTWNTGPFTIRTMAAPAGASITYSTLEALMGFNNQYTLCRDSLGSVFVISNTQTPPGTPVTLETGSIDAAGVATSTANYVFTLSNSNSRLAYYVDTGSGFGSPTTIDVGGAFANVNAAATPSGGVLVVWNNAGALYFSYKTPYTSAFSSPGTQIGTATANVQIPNTALCDASQGLGIIGWRLSTNNTINAVPLTQVFGAPPPPPPDFKHRSKCCRVCAI